MLHNWEFSNEIPADLSIEDYENLRFRFEFFLFFFFFFFFFFAFKFYLFLTSAVLFYTLYSPKLVNWNRIYHKFYFLRILDTDVAFAAGPVISKSDSSKKIRERQCEGLFRSCFFHPLVTFAN